MDQRLITERVIIDLSDLVNSLLMSLLHWWSMGKVSFWMQVIFLLWYLECPVGRIGSNADRRSCIHL